MCLFSMMFKWKMFVLEVLVPFQTNTFQWRTCDCGMFFSAVYVPPTQVCVVLYLGLLVFS